ncbi:BrnA antitoxin family protein [Candidatus Gracilibacteria bacterium]|nr:BrnA antitoxin family protein [Candidatus Gracilibacteria bacterium]
MTPAVMQFIDEEEKELYNIIDSPDFVIPKNELSPERIGELRQIAKNSTNEERTRISLRVPRRNLLCIKSQALQKGIPYQTYLNSIIHEHVHSSNK